MTAPNPSTAMARVVMDQLELAGVGLVVVSPGSRSAALAIAAASQPGIHTRVVVDERSAAFHALGAARASGRPAAVVSTSGSAPANFYPAVVEADMACVPLVVISADRPDELRGVGANQTIDQVDLFGGKVRGFAELAAPGAGADLNRHWRTTVSSLLNLAARPKPGPVHLNAAFREPTVPVSDDGRTRGPVYPFPTPRLDEWEAPPGTGRPGGFVAPLGGERGVVVAGDGSYDRAGLLDRAAELGWPVLATALSGMRGGGVISTYHHLLSRGIPPELAPTTVVAVGAIGPSQSLERLVAAAANRIRVDAWGRVIDPGRNATIIHQGDPLEVLDAVEAGAELDWAPAWVGADKACRDRLRSRLSRSEVMTGAGVADALNEVGWGALVAASSLPIREIDAHVTRPGAVYANRGASGIDGFVSTALGVAGVEPATLALSGDLSLLHDSNGFLHDDAIDLAMMVVDNGGGGLFDSLPPAIHAPDYERLFVAPHRRDLADLARFHHLAYRRVGDVASLIAACDGALSAGGVTLIHVPVDRGDDLRMRSQLEA